MVPEDVTEVVAVVVADEVTVEVLVVVGVVVGVVIDVDVRLEVGVVVALTLIEVVGVVVEVDVAVVDGVVIVQSSKMPSRKASTMSLMVSARLSHSTPSELFRKPPSVQANASALERVYALTMRSRPKRAVSHSDPPEMT